MFAITTKAHLTLTREARVGIALATPVLISGMLLLFAAMHRAPAPTDGQHIGTEVQGKKLENKLALGTTHDADARMRAGPTHLEQSQK
jgi:hypothetical protein